jgi:hypothetical protein
VDAGAAVIAVRDRLVLRRRLRAGVAAAGWAAAAGGIAGGILLAAPWGGRDSLHLACLASATLPMLAFALGSLLCRVDRTALLLEVDGRMQSSDVLASAADFAASGRDGPLRHETLLRAAALAGRAGRLWPRKPGVILPIAVAIAGGSVLGFALATLPPVPVVEMPQASAVPETGTPAARPDEPRPELPPEPIRKKAAEAGRRVAAVSEGIVDDRLRARGMQLADALAAYAEGRGDAAQVLAASTDFAEAAKKAVEAADTPEAREVLAKMAKALEADPLTEAIARALAKKDLAGAASMLKDLASRLSPEEVRRLSEKFKGLGGNLGLDLPGMLPGDGKGGAGGPGPGPGPGGGDSPGAGAGGKEAGKEPDSREASGPAAEPGKGPEGEPPGANEEGKTGAESARTSADGSDPGRKGPDPAKDPLAAGREPGKGGAEPATGRPPTRSGSQGLADAMKALVASATGSDAAERIRRTEPDRKAGAGTAAAGTESGKPAGPERGDAPPDGTGGGAGEKAGTAAGGAPMGKAERLEVTLKDEKAGRGVKEVVSVQEAVLRGATQGAQAPGFREVVRDYREITAEDLGRTGLPPAMRAMVEAYFDRLER